MRKKLIMTLLSLMMALSALAAVLVGCDKKESYFDKETVFHVDLSMSTAFGPLGTVCDPGTITFRTDGTAKFYVPFNETGYSMMDNLLGFRIPDFDHNDTYTLDKDTNTIIYQSTRKSFEEPMELKIETLSDGSMKFIFDISVQIPDTVLYFYSNEAMMPKPDEPDPDEPETFSVSFDAGEEAVLEEGFALPADEEYEEAAEITLPEAKFTREGNVFRGWAPNGKAYEEGGTYLYQPGETVVVDYDVNFVAVWSDTLTVTLTKGANAKSTSLTDMVFYVQYGKYFYFPANAYEYKDYTKGFAGWTNDGGTTVKLPTANIKITADTVFEPVWAEYVNVTFKASADDTTSFVIRTPKGTNVVFPDASCVGANAAAFAGWLLDGKGTSVKKPGDSAKVSANAVYIAKTAAKVTLTFDANGAEGKAPAPITAGNGLYFFYPECELTKEGYVFNGWGTSKTATSGSMPGVRTTSTADKTYYATWNAVRTVSFATGIDGKTIESVQQGQTMKIELPEMPYENGNKLFDGWTDGTKIYQAGASYTVPKDKDTELTAVWRDLITVKFDGGEGATGTVEDIEVYETKSFEIPANTYVQAGKAFVGWTDGSKNYMPGENYKVAETAESELTFTAIWIEGSPYSKDYSLTFRASQAVVRVNDDITLNNLMFMSELILRPDSTADYVVRFLEKDSDLKKHTDALGMTVAQLRAMEIDQPNISYVYDAETNKVTLNLADGTKSEITLKKVAKSEARPYKSVEFGYTLATPIGSVNELVFAALDEKPAFVSETKSFTGTAVNVADPSDTKSIPLTINPDGTGTLKYILSLTFNHAFSSDYSAVIWYGDQGDRIEAAVTKNENGMMTFSVSLSAMGKTYKITMVENAA